MEQTKASLVNSRNIPHQQAIVDLMTDNTVRPKRFTVPGGATVIHTMDETTLQQAVYTWLRGVNAFTECRISMAADPDALKLREYQFREFPNNTPQAQWEQPGGLLDLASQITRIFRQHQAVTIDVRREGLYYSLDQDGTFAPERPATSSDVEAAAELLDGQDAPFGIGDPIWNEAWEPFVEFIPKSRPRYGR